MNPDELIRPQVSPFIREQLRWALACYRRSTGHNIPTIRNRIIDLLGEVKIDTELSNMDLYNFLNNGKDTRAFKLKIIFSFLQAEAPQYVKGLTEEDFLVQFGDYLERFFGHNRLLDSLNYNKEIEHKKFLTSYNFVAPDWFKHGTYNVKESLRHAELANVLSFRPLGKSGYLQTVEFRVNILDKPDEDHTPNEIELLEKFDTLKFDEQ